MSSAPKVVIEENDRGILDDLESAEAEYDVDYFKGDKFEKAAVVIQRQARVMIARNNFRVALYKLILLKNIVETKMHKERMQMLYAFEQLIINTEGLDSSDEDAEEENKERSKTSFIDAETGLSE